MNRSTLAKSLGLLAAILALTIALSLFRWLPVFSFWRLIGFTPESLLIVAATIAVAQIWAKRRALVLVIIWVLAIAASMIVLFGVGEAFYQSIYREGFVPWTDLSFIPALLNMVFVTEVFMRPGLALVPVVAIVAIVTVLLFLILRGIGRLTLRVKRGATLAVVGALALVSLPVMVSPDLPLLSVRLMRQIPRPDPVGLDGTSVANTSSTSIGVGRSGANQSYVFPGLKDRNLHLMIVESYGHTLFSNPEHRQLIKPVYAQLAEKLRQANVHSYSSFLVSPAFGGRSWLADSTLLTGRFVDSQALYDQMVESEDENLTHLAGQAGYHRLLAAPGTYEAGDTWRSFYEFDSYLFRYDFGYKGPFVSFGAMPDQYLINRAHLSFKDIGKPVFATYILVSSHVPFDRVPPYIEDWADLGDGTIYETLGLREFNNNWLAGGEYPEGYVASIEYSLTSIVEYITEVTDDGGLMIIVGDHQPRVPISEPSASFSVPVHVLSRDYEIVEQFRHFGFTRGFVPDDDGDHLRMDVMNHIILTVAQGQAAPYSAFTR